MLHHVIENRVDRGLFRKSPALSPHTEVSLLPLPAPTCRCILDWAVARSVCPLRHNVFINSRSGNKDLPFHVILFLKNRNVSHKPTRLVPQGADVAAAYVGFGDKNAAGPAGTHISVKCQTHLNASSLFGPAGTTEGTYHLFIISSYFSLLLMFSPLLFLKKGSNYLRFPNYLLFSSSHSYMRRCTFFWCWSLPPRSRLRYCIVHSQLCCN